MVTQLRKSILTGLILALVAGLFILAVVLFMPSRAPAAPTIAWAPSSVTETILAGESKTVSVSFTASSDLSNVVVQVVPELQPYVQTNPAGFGGISKWQTVNFDLIISAPASSLPGAFEGTVQLRSGNNPNKTFARPLPVTINIEWPQQIAEGVLFNHPPDWDVQIFPETPEEEPTIAVQSPAGSEVIILPAGGFPYGIDPDATRTISSISFDGLPALRVDYRDAFGELFLTRVVFDPPLAAAPDFRIEFRPMAGDSEAEVLFEEILQTIQLQ